MSTDIRGHESLHHHHHDTNVLRSLCVLAGQRATDCPSVPTVRCPSAPQWSGACLPPNGQVPVCPKRSGALLPPNGQVPVCPPTVRCPSARKVSCPSVQTVRCPSTPTARCSSAPNGQVPFLVKAQLAAEERGRRLFPPVPAIRGSLNYEGGVSRYGTTPHAARL